MNKYLQKKISRGAKDACEKKSWSRKKMQQTATAVWHLAKEEGITMPQLAIYAELEAKPGKEQEVANLLKSAQSLAERENGTITWYAIRMGGNKFGIFDTFADDRGREAHVNGEIAKSINARAKDLLAKEPQFHMLDILASKSPLASKAHTA
jgi:quinol monooxygenase YgiN